MNTPARLYCTDCETTFNASSLLPEGRCPQCGFRRIIEPISLHSHQAGNVKVNFTVGRLPKKDTP